MTDPEREKTYTAETLRLAQVLQSIARSQGVSIRSLEKEIGVSEGLFNKILSGKVTLQVRHVLMICDALGLSWADFFAKAYAPEGRGDEALEEKIMEVLVRTGLVAPGTRLEPPKQEP
jgi:transcriptional regulator with XRE-family HTH domain